MSDYSTFEARLADAIINDASLPEFVGDTIGGNGKLRGYGNVFAIHGDKAGRKSVAQLGDLDKHVQYVCSKNAGLALVFFGRSGEAEANSKKELLASVTYKAELYIDPIRFVKAGGRSMHEMEENVLRAIHGLVIPPAVNHMEALQVRRWYEASHGEMYATRIEIERPFGVFPV